MLSSLPRRAFHAASQAYDSASHHCKVSYNYKPEPDVQTVNYFYDYKNPNWVLQPDHGGCEPERKDERDDCYEVFSQLYEVLL